MLNLLGGYVYMEGKGKSSVSRLFSPPFPGNATHCLSFFFTMAYNSPNSTLTVYRLVVTPPIKESHYMTYSFGHDVGWILVYWTSCGGLLRLRSIDPLTGTNLRGYLLVYLFLRVENLIKYFFFPYLKKNLWQKNLCYLLLTDAIDFKFVKTIVIEASTDSGGIGLDDIRLKKVSCSSNYFR